MHLTGFSGYRPLFLALSASLLVMGCGDKAKAPATSATPPPPEVSVITITPHPITLSQELPGRIQAFRTAEVRARVEGIIQKRVYEEGSEVKAGQELFRIDPAVLQATQASAEAEVARADAVALQAKLKANRLAKLVSTKAVSKQEYDEAAAIAKQAEAEMAAANAALVRARLDLSYATVTAPIPGRIGRALVTEGALVGKNEATHLATIEQIDPVYVNFTQPSGELLRIRKALASGQVQMTDPSGARVTLMLDDGSEYASAGKLLFSEWSVDPGTGEVVLRAEFANPKRYLLPGMYVRVKLEEGVAQNAITVPQRAVQRTGQGTTVMILDAENKVKVQPIRTGQAQGDEWIVTQGLEGGEQVIVEGLQKIKPGALAKPVPFQAPADAASNKAG